MLKKTFKSIFKNENLQNIPFHFRKLVAQFVINLETSNAIQRRFKTYLNVFSPISTPNEFLSVFTQMIPSIETTTETSTQTMTSEEISKIEEISYVIL